MAKVVLPKIINMPSTTEQNKAIVRRFNTECIEEGNAASFHEILSPRVINHAARAGMPNGIESFDHFLNEVLRKGFSNIRISFHQQIAEKDLVATRKTVQAVHTGEIFGIPPSNKAVEIHVIDIIRLEDGRYAEHWGQSNFNEVLEQLKHNQ